MANAKPTEVITEFKLRQMNLKDEMCKDFVVYSNEVNLSRAFAYLAPGFKPIAGHALWAMWVNGRRSNKPYTKSAKVEGEAMSFSPHGGCLTSDTKMFLLNGTVKTLGELVSANKDEWVLSIDKDGKIIPALATDFRKTKDVNELYEITFANGFSIKATGNHKFRLINGDWVAAENLHAGHIIDYGKFHDINDTYLSIYGNKTRQTSLHRLVDSYFNGTLSRSYNVHHVDENPRNNIPINLQRLSISEHRKIHHKHKCAQSLVLNNLVSSLKSASIRHNFDFEYISKLTCYNAANNIPFITSVKKIEVETIPVYDFTVNGPENALISISNDNSLLACAHNSYGSLARMAADYIYHIPYIDGHGSFGSAIGGPTPGAARYTEMRLSKFTEDVLFYNTRLLDMGLNYLEEDPEPILKSWQALLPLLFITNTSGMGYTVSNSWSSGNLYEFKEQLINYLKTGKTDCSNMYPDFPTGGVIVNKSDMKELYETGKGTIHLRGKTEIDGNTIRILSLPYQVYPEQFIDDIKKYINNNANTITDVSNLCGKKGFKIEIDCEDGTAEYTLDQLFKKTCLQVNISDERKAIDESGKPTLITFQHYMESFVTGNIEIVIKEANYNLEEIKNRLELIEGLLNALDIIDEIIATIKKSKSMDDAKQAIMGMNKYKFSERQADYIVHTPLGRLANLEQVKLHDEKKELEKQKTLNEDLATNRKSQEKYFLRRFNALIDKYAWERKTEVIDVVVDNSTEKPVRIAKPASLKPKKEFMIVLTSENCLKRIDVMKFRQTEEDEKNFKVAGNRKIVMVSNKGQMYKVFSNMIDLCLPTASGTPIANIRPEIGDEQIVAIYSDDVDIPYIYFLTKNGLGKMSECKSTLHLSKAIGTVVCGLKSDDDEIISIKLLKDGEKIEITTSAGRKEIVDPGKSQGRGSAGKKVIYLKKDETITEVHSV
jgi:DNA gyrase subunit A